MTRLLYLAGVAARGKGGVTFWYLVSKVLGQWFERAHLDIETNLKFVFLFLQKAFSYEFVRLELKLTDKTINDWCYFCREVIIDWVVSRVPKIIGLLLFSDLHRQLAPPALDHIGLFFKG